MIHLIFRAIGVGALLGLLSAWACGPKPAPAPTTYNQEPAAIRAAQEQVRLGNEKVKQWNQRLGRPE